MPPGPTPACTTSCVVECVFAQRLALLLLSREHDQPVGCTVCGVHFCDLCPMHSLLCGFCANHQKFRVEVAGRAYMLGFCHLSLRCFAAHACSTFLGLPSSQSTGSWEL